MPSEFQDSDDYIVRPAAFASVSVSGIETTYTVRGDAWLADNRGLGELVVTESVDGALMVKIVVNLE